jgi:hypothetical protein
MVITTEVRDDAATVRVAFYREPHRIVPTENGTGFFCAHDGVRLNPRKGGFTHNVADVYRAQDEAGYVPVGKCRECGQSYAAHIRGLLLRSLAFDHPFTE